MIGKARKLGLLVFLALFTVGYAAAQGCPTGHYIDGNVLIGGTAAPAGITVNLTGGTSGYSEATATVNAQGFYGASFTANSSSPCPSGFVAGEALTYRVSGSTATTTAGCPSTFSAGGISAGCNLSISASCTDGILNGNEVLADCGGSCGSCLSAAAVSISADTAENATNATGTLTISSGASASGGTPPLNVTVTKGNLVGTTNSSDVISASNVILNASNFLLTKGSSRVILVTVLVPSNSTDTYTGQINISTNSSNVSATSTVTVTVSSGLLVRRSSKYMVIAITGPDGGAQLCVKQPVMIVVTDERRGKAVDRADVDVYLNNDKVFNVESDAKGQAKFTPANVGDYLLQIDASGYRRYEKTVTVEACGAVEETTSTVQVTTTVKLPETTVEVTSTVKEATTTAQVTTSVKQVTTIPVAPAAKKGTSSLIIIVVVVIVIVVAAVAMKKKGGGEVVKEAPKK